MRINTRTIALALTAVTLFTTNIAMNIKGDSTMSSIFYIISIGFSACALEAWLEYRRDKRIGGIK